MKFTMTGTKAEFLDHLTEKIQQADADADAARTKGSRDHLSGQASGLRQAFELVERWDTGNGQPVS